MDTNEHESEAHLFLWDWNLNHTTHQLSVKPDSVSG
jgi:hypothetical protein